jgi:leucyl aminopeptidase (aminopeptidase T)
LEDLLNSVDRAGNIAELGIGINPQSLMIDDIYELKKYRGSAHLGLGDSASGYGGKVESDLHIDGMMFDVTIKVDGRTIIENGKHLYMSFDDVKNAKIEA